MKFEINFCLSNQAVFLYEQQKFKYLENEKILKEDEIKRNCHHI